MTKNKKQWVSLIMAMIMLIALLPDSFLSAVRAWAENNEKSVTLKFTADGQLDSKDFSFVLYELTDTDAEYEDKEKELTSTDGMYLLPVAEKKTSDNDESADQSHIGENAITADITINESDNSIQVQLEGVSENNKYVYEFKDNQNKYFTCTNIIDTSAEQNLSKEETLKILGTAEKKVSLSIAQNAAETLIDVKYNIYPVIKADEYIFRKQETDSGSAQQVSNTASDIEIDFSSVSLYNRYEIEFYTDSNEILNKTVYIDYDSDTNSYKLADSTDDSITLESNKIDIFLQFDFSDNETATEIKGTAELYFYDETKGDYSETPIIKTSPVSLADAVFLGTLELPFASQYKIKIVMENESSIYKTNQEFLDIVLNEADIKAPVSGIGNKTYTLSGSEYKLEQKQMASLDFTEKVEKREEETETKNIVRIQASASDLNLEINGADYISGKMPEDAILTCSLQGSWSDKNVKLEYSESGDKKYTLSIPAYFTGEIPVVYRLEKNEYQTIEKIVNFNVSYEEISKVDNIKLPDNANNKIYSNKKISQDKDFRPVITADKNYTFYAVSKRKSGEKTELTSADEDKSLKDGVIILEENLAETVYYDIYAVDENKKIYQSELELNIDTKNFTITISYEDGAVNEYNGKNYYQERKAKVSFDESKSESSINKENFRKNFHSLIDSITYGKDIISGSSLKISDTASNGWYQITNETDAIVYEISEWDVTEKCYYIIFKQNGIYNINTITDFTDEYGNAASITFQGNDPTEFILDNIAPIADCEILVRKYADDNTVLTPITGKVREYITTSLGKDNIFVTTSLRNISDIISGVRTVECIVTKSPINPDDLEKRTDWKSSVSFEQGIEYKIETASDKSSCTVTFTNKRISEKYYVYYKAVDSAGNTNFFNELGIILDNEAPEIDAFKYTDDITGNVTTGKISEEFYFNHNITASFKITDDNFQTDKNDGNIITGIKVTVNDTEITDIKWNKGNENTVIADYLFTAEENETKIYKIKIECEDKAGIPAIVHEETLIIDKQLPEIEEYKFRDIDNQNIQIVNTWKDDNKNIVSVIGKDVKTDVKVKFQIKEIGFDKELIDIEIKSNNSSVPVSLDSIEWTKNGDIYENSVTLTKKDGEETIYDITINCTDKAGNKSAHTQTLIIDKKSPIITVNYKENKEGGAYYKNRTAEILIDEQYSLNEVKLLEAIKEAVKAEPALPEQELLNISSWDSENHKYTIEFIGNAKYTISKINYTDESGNTAEDIIFGDNTTHKTEFFVDKEAPTAKAQLVLYQYDNETPIIESNINIRPLFISTFFKKQYDSQFVLYDIQDNLTGIKTVEYYLSKEPVDINKISGVTWYSHGKESSVGEKTVLTEENGSKRLTVSLPEPEKSSVYYIYYRITDNTGENIAFLNGAGIILDQDEPEILDFEYEKLDNNVVFKEISEAEETIYAFSDNVNIKITLKDEHFNAGKSIITVQKYEKSGESTDIYTTILERKDWIAQDKDTADTYISEISLTDKNLITNNGKSNQYKITVTAKDMAGRVSTHSEIVRIDKEKPVVIVEYDDSNKIENHYYDGERRSVISVQKTFHSSVDESAIREALIKGIIVKDVKNEIQNIETGKEEFYNISDWDAENQCYTIIYQKDSIYEFDLSFLDKLGNENETILFAQEVKDGSSFVINSKGPKISVSYNDSAKKADYYYGGKRTAELEITDLSFTYAYNYDNEAKKILNEDNFNENFVKLNTTAENPFNQYLLLPAEPKWEYKGGIFKTTISYEKDAVYTFGISGKNICQKEVTVNYKNNIKDGESFVIDSSVPVITVTYDDKNKKTDDYLNGYYQGSRTAKIEVEDLSLYYARTTTSPVHQEYPLTEEYIEWKIEAKDIQNNDVEKAYRTTDFDETGWIFDSSSSVFKREISYIENAAYSFSIKGRDICGNENEGKSAQILYKNILNKSIEDGESFVIDTQIPMIAVEYMDENKFEDHYYIDTRTALVTISDLSLAYAYRKSGIRNPEAVTDKDKINWIVNAKNEKGEDVTDAYLRSDKWEFSEENGTYIQKIEFTAEAIYEFSLSGGDLCGNTFGTDEVEYQAADGNSFVIDRAAPKITIEYNDVNKQTERYYKAERTADIIVSDLSYIYEEVLAEASGNSKPELTASWRIPILITAEDALNQEVLEAYKSGEWTFADGIYKKTIAFDKDAIYHFEILKERNAEDVWQDSAADIYGRIADISYRNQSGIAVTDYDSFVISRKNPEVIVTYNDSEENKQEDYYYKDTRTANITVSDLSYVYEDKFNQNKPEEFVINHADRINMVITAEDTRGISESFDKVYQEAWSFDSENGVYRKTITFDEDAIYSLELSGKNIFGREAEITYQNKQEETIKDGTSFVIDREAPVITVTYDDANKKIDYYQNHFYAGERTAVIEISDLSYVYEDQQRAKQNNPVYITNDRVKFDITAVNESGINVDNAYTQSEWSFDKTQGIYRDVIEFSEDAIYGYSMQADDIYGNSIKEESEENNITVNYQTNNKTEVTDYASFVIDTNAPKVIAAYDDRNKGTNTAKQEYTNGYYKDERTVNITVSDLSFVYADKYMPEKTDTENLVLNKTDDDINTYILPVIRAYSNDMEIEVQNAHNMNTASLWSWNEAQNGYQASITFMAEAAYSFEIRGEDICKNMADISYSDIADANRFVIDKTAPTISITYNDNTPVRTIDGRGYFSRTRTAEIVITEGCDTFDREDALNHIIITAKDADGNGVDSGTYTISGWTESKASENRTATRYTATITYRGNANYIFEISYMDKTGHAAVNINTNSSTTPYTFTVDSGAPTGTVSVSGFGSWNRLTELLTFDRWSNSVVNITASAEDGISSVYSVKYYKTANVTAMTRQQLLDLSDSSWTDYREFSVRPDEMFSVYLRVEDRSGNISFISSDGVIVDATAPSEESIAPEITVTPAQPINNIYNTDVTVDITVTDPIVNGSYSGLKSIRYEVQNMGAVTQQGQLYTFNYATGQTLQSQLLQRWNGQIVVDRNLNNSNDVRIVVYAQDNSDNISDAYTAVQIDVTQPSINISYDNNNGDASFGAATYFNADRTATIRITERNFNADDVQITITNTDGVMPSISGWSSSAGTGNGDDAVHTATVAYSADGDYVFTISYADLAGNINTAVDYGNSSAPEQFTIDKTLPVINVTYDNNSVQNDNYYNAVRTATVSITEHNFDAGRYTITLTASDDGTNKGAPSIGGWSNNGDIHTASVQFTDDGYYTMNMSYTDMAGNQAAQFAQQTFYVDTTMPRVAVKGIKNNTANNDETIGFEITCTDTNFDVFTPQLNVTKMIQGTNVTENCEMNQIMSIRNGQTYIVDNLDQDGIYSLTCTARDKAGNVFNRVVYLNEADQEEDGMDASEGIFFLNFSVNRSGSVYTLDSYTNEVAKYYYVKDVEENLVIVETNVDTLNGYIELNGKRLTEGTDYQVEISGGNGEWYVVRYIINKELFAGEGEYKIIIYSEDNAGNTAYSDIKGTNMSFVIDKTAPVVTVAGIENNGRYQVERQTVTVIPKDDGGKLQKIMIEAFDQNGDMLEGFPIVYEGEDLLTLLEENNGELTFELPEGTGMSVRITCEDSAGNEMDMMSFDNIVVSTSRLTIILANKTLIYGIIAGLLVLTAVIILLIVWKKHKKKTKEKSKEGQA